MFRLNWKFECKRVKTQFRFKYTWKKPAGYDTNIEVYDERVKTKVPLIFPNKNYVKWYMCGPTVYDTSHIGHASQHLYNKDQKCSTVNFIWIDGHLYWIVPCNLSLRGTIHEIKIVAKQNSCYVRLDIIHRILKEYYDIHPVVAIGVTDVSEEILKKAKLLNKPIWEITKKYSSEFFEQMDALNVLPPAFKLNVTQHINDIIQFIDLLVRRRAAYVGMDGTVYFSVEAVSNYGKFREVPQVEALRSPPGKRDPRDFALWKSDEECGQWNSPWGVGTPGWHIECSAMASSVFGGNIDLHSGGSDLIFPHHENEEAQSACYHKCEQWVNYWLHTGLTHVGNVKMSKSLGNSLPIREFLEQYKSDHLRMLCLMSSYRADFNFEDPTIQLAIGTYDKICSFLDMTESYVAGTWLDGNVKESELLQELEKTKEKVREHLSNDFGTPEALKAVMLLVKNSSKMLQGKNEKTSGRSPAVIAMLRLYVKQFFDSFGFTLAENLEKNQSTCAINTIATAVVNARAQVRNVALKMRKSQKKGSVSLILLCDQFRDKILSSGLVINDLGPNQSQWSFKSSAMDNKTLLKDLIDCIVWFRHEVLAVISNLSLSENTKELSDICKYIKVYFGTLGVDIRDNSNGRLEWTFPNSDKENARVLEGVIVSALQFHSQIRETADKLPEDKTKDKLMWYCDSVISDLDELGVKVDEKRNLFEIQDETGMFLLSIIVDIVVHFRQQGLVIASTTEDEPLKNDLFKANALVRKKLGSFGFYVHEPSANLTSSWNMKFASVNSSVFVNIVDIAVNLLGEMIYFSKRTNDKVSQLIITDVCKSTIDDLRSLGIEVKNLGKRNPTWYFQPSKFQGGYPLTCAPVVSLEEWHLPQGV